MSSADYSNESGSFEQYADEPMSENSYSEADSSNDGVRDYEVGYNGSENLGDSEETVYEDLEGGRLVPPVKKQKTQAAHVTPKRQRSPASKDCDDIDENADGGEDVVGGDDATSNITDSGLDELKSDYAFLANRDLRIPGPDDSIKNPPSEYFSVYAAFFKYGMSLPLAKPFVDILNGYNIALVQLSPKSIAILIALQAACEKAKVSFGWDLVRRLYRIQMIRGSRVQYALYCYLNRKIEFVGKYPSNFGNWKRKFFYVRYDETSNGGKMPSWHATGVRKSVSKKLKYTMDSVVVRFLLPYCVNASDFIASPAMSNLANAAVEIRQYDVPSNAERVEIPAANTEPSQVHTKVATETTTNTANRDATGRKRQNAGPSGESCVKRAKLTAVGVPIVDAEVPEGSLVDVVKGARWRICSFLFPMFSDMLPARCL